MNPATPVIQYRDLAGHAATRGTLLHFYGADPTGPTMSPVLMQVQAEDPTTPDRLMLRQATRPGAPVPARPLTMPIPSEDTRFWAVPASDSEPTVTVRVTRSAGRDAAWVVEIDVDGPVLVEDDGPGMRVYLGEAELHADMPPQYDNDDRDALHREMHVTAPQVAYMETGRVSDHNADDGQWCRFSGATVKGSATGCPAACAAGLVFLGRI